MIEIEEHSADWLDYYENEKSAIINRCGATIEAIEHIGSTAVISLPAKPTIDICIGVKNLESIDAHTLEVLNKLGYEYIEKYESEIPDRRYLQKIDASGKHLTHIHAVEFRGKLWREYIYFRDYLMSHPEDAKRYAELKNSLKEKFSQDRIAYTEGKGDFIKSILKKMR